MKHCKAEQKVPLCKNFCGTVVISQTKTGITPHSKKLQPGPVQVVANNPTKNVSQNQGFQTAKLNLAPPSKNPGIQKDQHSQNGSR